MTVVMKLGNYEVLGEIGRGGMSVVYQARDARSGQMVALKELVLSNVLAPEESSEAITRFQREGQMAARLEHPSIIKILETGEAEGRHFIAMEMVEGRPLKSYIDSKIAIPIINVLDIVLQICQALQHAHSQGVVHRDVKPDNITVMKSGQIKLADFGIARVAGATGDPAKRGTLLGTLAYLAPELLQDLDAATPRSDIYSLGATMYELLTLRAPISAQSIPEFLQKIATERPVAPRQYNPQIPPPVEAAIQRCLQKNPDMRYASAQDLFNELSRFRQLLSSKAGPPQPGQPAGPTPVMGAQPAGAAPPMPAAPAAGTKTCGSCRTGNLPGNYRFCPMCGTKLPEAPAPTGREPAVAAAPSPAAAPVSAVGMAGRTIKVTFKSTFGRPGYGKGEFNAPRDLAIHPKKTVYVADCENFRLQIFSLDGKWMSEITSGGRKGGKLTPGALCTDQLGKVYVVDPGDTQVKIYDPMGSIMGQFGTKGESRGDFKTPTGIAVSKRGNIYVSDSEASRIQVFSPQFQFLTSLGRPGTKPGELKTPYALGLDDEENLYILEYSIPRVQVMNRNGQSLRTFGQRGASKGDFAVPRGLCIDKFRNIYVADTLNHRLQVFDANGNVLACFGQRGNGEGEFAAPEGIDINDDLELAVTDKGNNRVQVFQIEFV